MTRQEQVRAIGLALATKRDQKDPLSWLTVIEATEKVVKEQVIAETKWKIADALATQEALASEQLEREYDPYWEGRRDAYDHAEQIASAGGSDEQA